MQLDERERGHDLLPSQLERERFDDDGAGVQWHPRQQTPEVAGIGRDDDAIVGEGTSQYRFVSHAQQSDMNRMNGVGVAALCQ